MKGKVTNATLAVMLLAAFSLFVTGLQRASGAAIESATDQESDVLVEAIGVCPTPTETPTNTPTNTPTETPTNTPTNTPTETPTNTPTNTPTETPTNTPTNTPTETPTNTPTNTPTPTPIPPTNTPTNTPTPTPIPPTNTPTNTPTATPTPTPTNTPTNTPTPTPIPPTNTPTNTPTPTPIPPTNTPTNTPTPTPIPPTNTPTNTPTPTAILPAGIRVDGERRAVAERHVAAVDPCPPETTEPKPANVAADVLVPVIARGATQTGHGTGFQPGEVVTAEQQSVPLSLGTQTANAEGAVTFTWTIRADETIGSHSFVVTGSESGTASASFRVVDETALPATGNDLSPVLVRALLLIVLGGFLVVATMQWRGARR